MILKRSFSQPDRPSPPERRTSVRQPPRWADRLLEWFVASHLLEYVQGDLHETFQKRVDQVGLSRARREYAWAVLHCLTPFFYKPLRNAAGTTALADRFEPRRADMATVPLGRNVSSDNDYQPLSNLHPAMLQNYLKIAWRTLIRHKLYSFINIGGLALSLTSSAFIGLWVYQERSYDSFHRDADRIYRVVKDFVSTDGARIPDATTPFALTPALKTESPDVEMATRLYPNWGQKFLIKQKDQQFYEEGVYRVDPNFFAVFSFPLVAGDAQTALINPKSVVLTESAAHKYFGNQNPMGKRLDLAVNGGGFTVTGVLKDIPTNAHFRFDFLIPLRTLNLAPDSEWKTYVFYTYVKLKSKASADRFEANLQALVNRHQPTTLNRFYMQPLTSIHLTSNLKWELAPNGDQSYVHILSLIALFVLVVAGINYVNLATARAARRAREVGVRKVAGAYRQSLIGQFLGEGMLVALVAGILAVGLLFLLVPFFSKFVEKQFDLWNQQGALIGLIVIGVACGVGALASIYPALILSSYEPVRVLKGQSLPSGQFSRIRQGLVTGQFAVSAGLILCTIVVTQQLHFLQTTPLGFDKEQVMVLSNVGGLANVDALRGELMRLPGVQKIGASSGILGRTNFTTGMARKGTDKAVVVNYMIVDNDGLDVLGVQLKEGRPFSAQFPSDSVASLLVNETAARQLELNHPLGSVINTNLQGDYRTVVGVVNDFHYSSLHQAIQPFAFLVGQQSSANLLIKVRLSNLAYTVQRIRHHWETLVPDRPFSYSFIDEQFAALHHADILFERVFISITTIALLIACLGLFALATFATERRTKEIGVRKVLGASEGSIVALLAGDFLRLIGVATVLASPLAYYFMSGWLQGFAYKITIEWWMFLLAGLITTSIALLTISVQSIKAAWMNPVKSLRSD